MAYTVTSQPRPLSQAEELFPIELEVVKKEICMLMDYLRISAAVMDLQRIHCRQKLSFIYYSLLL